MPYPSRLRILQRALVAFFTLGAACTARALTITPNFDSSITSDPNGAAMENTINTAIRAYETQFSDPISLSITFVNTTAQGLGASSSDTLADSYSDFLSKLTADKTTSADATAVSNLAVSGTNPVNGSSSMTLTTSNAKALGIFTADTVGGTIYLDTTQMNISRSGTINSGKYDMYAVVSHEIDEILGTGSSLVNGSNGSPAPTGSIAPIDLFRYDQNGVRSYTTSASAQAFLSLDGTTHLAQFNQISNSTNSGDFGDYNSFSGPHTPQVQDAYGTPGVLINLGNAEKTSLDAIGYNLYSSLNWMAASGTSTYSDGSGTWTNGGSSNFNNGSATVTWNNANNANAQFGGTDLISGTSYTVALGSGITVGTLTFANQTYTLSSSTNALTVNNGITSVANAIISAPVILGGTNSWQTVGTSMLTVNGGVTGPYSLAKNGPGILVLNGSDSYTGGTTVNQGTVRLGAAAALPTGSAVTVAGGAVDMNGQSPTIGNLTFGDGVSSTGASFVDSASVKGSATLQGGITYMGTFVNGYTYFPAGTLSANLTLAAGAHHITSADTSLAANYDLVISGTMSGPGGISKDGLTYLALTGQSTYTGPTTVTGGWLFLGVTNALPVGTAVTVNSGSVLSLNPINSQTGVTPGSYSQAIGSLSGAGQVNLGSATLSVGNDGTSTSFSGLLNGTGGLTKAGAGTFTLNSGQSYTGATTIASGTLQLGSGGSLASASMVTGSSGGWLVSNASSGVLFPNLVTGGVSLAQSGGGGLYLTGDNAYSGGTYINSGYLVVGNNTASGTLGSGPVVNNGTLYTYRSDTFTLANAISGAGNFIQQGAGMVTLTGSNTYTGSTNLLAGTSLQIGNGGTTGSIGSTSYVSGPGGTTLILNRSDNITSNLSIQNGIGVSQNGSGTLTIGNTATYTGPTTVNAGTLLVSGGITGSSTTVNAGATLGGTGTLGTVSVQAGGTISPGNTGAAGLLTTANLSLSGSSHFVLQLGGNTGTGTGGTTYDEVKVNGSVTLGGDLQISLLGITPTVGELFYIILNDGTDPVVNAFSNAPGGIVTSGGWEYTVNYAANGDGGSVGNDVALTALQAVPEPGSWAMLALGAFFIVRRRRRLSLFV